MKNTRRIKFNSIYTLSRSWNVLATLPWAVRVESLQFGAIEQPLYSFAKQALGNEIHVLFDVPFFL